MFWWNMKDELYIDIRVVIYHVRSPLYSLSVKNNTRGFINPKINQTQVVRDAGFQATIGLLNDRSLEMTLWQNRTIVN